MRKTLTYVLAGLCLLSASAGSARAQDGSALFRNWIQQQREAARRVDLVTMEENLLLTIEGSFGKQTLRVEAEHIAGPGANPPGRVIRRMEMGDREIPVEQGERFRRQMRGLWRPEIGRLLEGFRFPVQDLSRMRLAHDVVQEEHDTHDSGRAALMWRVDLVPQRLPSPVERMTAWFDLDSFRLRDALAVLRVPDANTVRLETSYERIDGLDLPRHVHAEGSSRMLRRMRYFTTFFEMDLTLFDHAILFSEE